MRTIAGITVFNPEIDRLRENILGIINQVDLVVLVNNGGLDDRLKLRSGINFNKVIIINNQLNLGVATALNQILQYALDNNYQFVLTLDQDSICPSYMIEEYLKIISHDNHNKLGIVSCNVVDRNFTLLRQKDSLLKDEFLSWCITSGSFVNVEAWKDVGKFDDSMFIDSVDFDFCIRLRKRGWSIFKTSKVNLLHELGKSKVIKIFGKEYVCSNYPPIRHYYICRNLIYQARKHHLYKQNFRVLVRHIYTTIFYENNKVVKILKIFEGIAVGLFVKINRYRC